MICGRLCNTHIAAETRLGFVPHRLYIGNVAEVFDGPIRTRWRRKQNHSVWSLTSVFRWCAVVCLLTVES